MDATSYRVPRRVIGNAAIFCGIIAPGFPRKPILAAFVAALSAVLAIAACSPGGTSAPRDGGMAANESVEVSIAIAQIRAKYPGLSAAGPAYEPRTSEALPLEQRVQMALRGQGSSIAPGALSGKAERVSLEFYVDKSAYQEGYAQITVEDGEAQRWQIVAYEHRGKADGEFEFVYLMSDPDGALRYLVILSRDWAETGGERRSFEATIIRPGKGARVDRWTEAYYFDLGLDQPVVPVFQNQIDAAETATESVGRNLKNLASLRRKHGNLEKRLNDLLDKQTRQPPTDARAKRVVELERKLGETQSQWEAAIHGAEQDVLAYYTLRGGIARSFAGFLESNYYRWQPLKVQQRFFDALTEIEEISNTMEEHLAELLPKLSGTARIESARKQAGDSVSKFGNAAKRPSSG